MEKCSLLCVWQLCLLSDTKRIIFLFSPYEVLMLLTSLKGIVFGLQAHYPMFLWSIPWQRLHLLEEEIILKNAILAWISGCWTDSRNQQLLLPFPKKGQTLWDVFLSSRKRSKSLMFHCTRTQRNVGTFLEAPQVEPPYCSGIFPDNCLPSSLVHVPTKGARLQFWHEKGVSFAQIIINCAQSVHLKFSLNCKCPLEKNK